MRFTALVAALALAFACSVEPDPPPPVVAGQVATRQASSTHPQLFEFRPIDGGALYMKELVEHVALDRRSTDIRGDSDVWIGAGGQRSSDYFLTASTRRALEDAIAAEPSLTLPAGRELAYGRLEDGRWRTYVVESSSALDTRSIAQVTLRPDAQTDLARFAIDFTPAGAQQLCALTSRTVGSKLAVLLNGEVVAAPVVASAITGGRAEISF